MTLAVILYARQEVDASVKYRISGSLRNVAIGSSNEVFALDGDLAVHMVGEHAFNLVIPLGPVGIPEAGEYALELRLDDGDPVVLPFSATTVDEANHFGTTPQIAVDSSR